MKGRPPYPCELELPAQARDAMHHTSKDKKSVDGLASSSRLKREQCRGEVEGFDDATVERVRFRDHLARRPGERSRRSVSRDLDGLRVVAFDPPSSTEMRCTKNGCGPCRPRSRA